jgi:hypothetical protein
VCTECTDRCTCRERERLKVSIEIVDNIDVILTANFLNRWATNTYIEATVTGALLLNVSWLSLGKRAWSSSAR